MMIIERQAAGGASTGSASGEAIEPTSFLNVLNILLIDLSNHAGQ